jgi:enoyl-[acyl-carrier protein] reductase II
VADRCPFSRAVSNAGGLGVLGPNAGLTAETAVSTPEETAEKMREEIRKTKRLTENLSA